jgi:phosphoribosylformylglycinamidine synthase
MIPSLNSVAPQVRFEDEAKANRAVHTAIQAGFVVAAHDISGGGTMGAVLEMLLGQLGDTQVGVQLTVTGDSLTELYSENGGYILAVDSAKTSLFEHHFAQRGIYFNKLGETVSGDTVGVSGSTSFEIVLPDVRAAWKPEI